MNEQQGKLIILEGGDGSGKATQIKLLKKALEARGTVTLFDFPRYEESVFGNLVGECLAGKHGDFLSMTPYLSSLPFMLDRISAKEKLIDALGRGYAICNRYTTSNIVHQSAKLPEDEREALTAFLEKGEYDELGLPRPDMVIYLYVPPEKARELVEKKGTRPYMDGETKHDLYEEDIDYQQKVACVYKEFAEKRDDWYLIECMDGNQLRTPEDIHEELMKLIA